MKKSIFILIILTLLSVLPIIAIASSNPEPVGSTDISYTVEESKEPDSEPPKEPDPEPPREPEPPSRTPIEPATYEINIPARISLNENSDIRITANYINIKDPDRAVVVWLDGNTFENNTLYLTNSSPERIGVTFYSMSTGGTPVKIEGMEPGAIVPVAFFSDGDTSPFVLGTLRLVASSNDIANAALGTYSGTVHFNISIGYK